MNLEALLKNTEVMEREWFTPETAHHLERFISRLAAIERYRIIRKYCHGMVVDAACGCGYGSRMLSKCPSVSHVVGYDIDRAAVEFARKEYEVDAQCLDFNCEEFAESVALVDPDVIVSVETIEHMEDASVFIDALLNTNASRLIFTFPSFETTSFNPYHLSDPSLDELEAMMHMPASKVIDLDDAVTLAVFER